MNKQTLLLLVSFLLLLLSCSDNTPDPTLTPTQAPITEKPLQSTAIADAIPSFTSADSLQKYYDEKITVANKLRANAMTDKNMAEVNSIDSQLQNTYREKHRSVLNFIALEGPTQQSLIVYRHLLGGYYEPYSFLDSIFMSFPEEYRENNTGKLYRKLIDKQKSESLKLYKLSLLDYAFRTPKGERTTLKNVPSEYILVDLWASWCIPCRKKNIELIRLNNNLPQNGKISIVAISLDTNEKKWKDAAAADSLNFTSLLEPLAFESPFIKALQVQMIPQAFLIDKKGNILSTDRSIEGITKTIKEL